MNEYAREEYEVLAPGLEVRDADGAPFGTIGDTVGEYVELRGGDQASSVWIRRTDFGEANHEAVLLGFPSDEIDERASKERPHTLDDAAETGVLASDAQRAREAMLEELAEQRAEMRETGRATEAADRSVGVPIEAELEQRGVH